MITIIVIIVSIINFFLTRRISSDAK